MIKNMGIADRAIRIAVAVALVILYFSGVVTGTIGIIALVVAVVFVLTSMVSLCPLYSLLGIKTLKSKTAK